MPTYQYNTADMALGAQQMRQISSSIRDTVETHINTTLRNLTDWTSDTARAQYDAVADRWRRYADQMIMDTEKAIQTQETITQQFNDTEQSGTRLWAGTGS